MSYEREQKLIDICFELVLTTQQSKFWFQDKGTEEVMEWVADQLHYCGFPTHPVGGSWGKLERNNIISNPVLNEGAILSNTKNRSQETGKIPTSPPPAPKAQPLSSEDRFASLLLKIYGAMLEQNRLIESTNFSLENLSKRLGND